VLFHVEPSSWSTGGRYQRALKQRNAALRSGRRPPWSGQWDPELIEAGLVVADFRGRYLTALGPHVAAVAERLLGQSMEIGLLQGWSAERSLDEAVAASWERDRERGLTHAGPHRADLSVRFAGAPSAGSHFQGTAEAGGLGAALRQLRCDAALGSRVAALLVDDPAAELDSGI